MVDNLKAIMVLLLLIAGVFGAGVMVGLKLEKNEDYRRWLDERQSRARLEPAQVAVIQMPGAPLPGTVPAYTPLPAPADNAVAGDCPGGVCQLPPAAVAAAAAAPAALPAAEKMPDLTFYAELSDKPSESGGAALMVKKKPQVGKVKAEREPESIAAPAPLAPAAGLWELQICSLPQEIKARVERGKLLHLHSAVEIEPVAVKDRGTWYRVKISNLKDRAAAEKLKLKLEELKYNPLLIKQKM